MLEVRNRIYRDHLGRTITGGMPTANEGNFATIIHEFRLNWSVTLSYDITLSISASKTSATLSGVDGGWKAIGVTVGDTVLFTALLDTEGTLPALTASVTVDFIDGDTIFWTGGVPAYGLFIGGGVVVNKDPEGVIIKFNLADKNSSNLNSVIDGTELILFNKDITSLTQGGSALPLTIQGQQSGSIVDKTTIRRLNNDGGRIYEVEIRFYWWAYLTNMADYHLGTECLAPVIDATFLPLWNEPNVGLRRLFKNEGEGNSGFRDENYNINSSNFQITQSYWLDSNNVVIPTFDVAKPSTLVIEAVNLSGNGFAGTAGLIFFNDIEDEENYSYDPTNTNGGYNHAQHTILFSKEVASGNVVNQSFTAPDGANYTVETSWTVTGQVIQFTAKFTPNQQFINRFTDPNNTENTFVALLRVESSSYSTTNYIDTVNLLAWRGVGEDLPVNLGNIIEFNHDLHDHYTGTYTVMGRDEVITEDDLRWGITAKNLEIDPDGGKILGIEPRIVMSHNGNTHTLWNYYAQAPDTYDNQGALLWNELIPMYWNDFMPQSLQGTLGIQNDNELLQLNVPFLIDWRYFRPLPTLVNEFGSDATKNFKWYNDLPSNIMLQILVHYENGIRESNPFPLTILDYDHNPDINWVWDIKRLSDGTTLQGLIDEPMEITVTGTSLTNPFTKSYATVTVEPFENDFRWLISSIHDSSNMPNSPLQPIQGVNVLDLDYSPSGMECYMKFEYYPDKMDVSGGVKFTARHYDDSKTPLEERNVKLFPVAKLPKKDLPQDENKEICGECCVELKLASSTESDIARNDITGVVHKNQLQGDTCQFVIFKDGALLNNVGVDYTGGLPNDPDTVGFVYNWKHYLMNHGEGLYIIRKNYTVAGISYTDKVGEYQLCEYSKESAEGSVRVLYQNDFETLYENELINFSGSGFEDSYRFKGFFGLWQPNTTSESNYSYKNESRVNTIKSNDTYTLRHFGALECHLERLHRIALSASVWRVSWHNKNNTLQKLQVLDCVLDNSNKELITYHDGARKTIAEIVLKKRSQNSVSLFDGSIELTRGASFFLPTVQGGGGGGSYNLTFNGGFSQTINQNENYVLKDSDGNIVPITGVSNNEINLDFSMVGIYPIIVVDGREDLTVDTYLKTNLSFDGVIELVRINLQEEPIDDDIYIDIKINGTPLQQITVWETTKSTTMVVNPNVTVSSGDEVEIEVTNIGSTQSGAGLVVTFLVDNPTF